jgi:hypothetical protein
METGAAQYFDEAARWLKAEKVHVEPGLNDTEVDAIEGRYEFRFLRTFGCSFRRSCPSLHQSPNPCGSTYRG